MNDIIEIKRHEFDSAIANINEFTKKTKNEIEVYRVSESGWIFSHKVTGSELNTLSEKVHKELIDLNNLQIDFIKEFENVYKALDSLDKDYINAILIAIHGLKKNADDITKAVTAQKKIVEILKAFKEKLETFKNLENVDMMWDKLESLNQYIEILTEKNKKLEIELKEIRETLDTDVKTANKKAKIASILAGISLALVIVQFIVMGTKVL